MSVVTNAILCFSVMELETLRIKDVNDYFENKHGFVSCDDEGLPNGWYGGTKMLETNVAIGSLNHLNLEDFCLHLQEIEWEEPENVQLIICEQEAEKFRIIELPANVTRYTTGESEQRNDNGVQDPPPLHK